jgi:mono/diheme cytochrome c family protein
MKKFFKITGIVLGVIVVLVAGLLSYVSFALPDVGKPMDIKVTSTPESIKRGEYLANHVMGCVGCHSERNWNEFSGTLVPGTLGKGGERFDQHFGFPGVYIARNITPAGISDYTDGELYRAITTGVKKNGEPIFPMMPYQAYGRMDPNDIKAVISYIRSLPAIENKTEDSKSDFPMNFIVRTIPQKAEPQNMPSPDDVVNYGKYLVNACACQDCHTPFDKGKFDMNYRLAGGREFQLPWGKVTSANLTPDPETGIGSWTKESFVTRFKSYVDSNNNPVHTQVGPNDFNTIMPWTMFGGMNESDLNAIYEYLRTLPAIKHTVVKFKPAS